MFTKIPIDNNIKVGAYVKLYKNLKFKLDNRVEYFDVIENFKIKENKSIIKIQIYIKEFLVEFTIRLFKSKMKNRKKYIGEFKKRNALKRLAYSRVQFYRLPNPIPKIYDASLLMVKIIDGEGINVQLDEFKFKRHK